MSKGMPYDRFEMERANYQFTGTSKCRSCSAPVEWWKTTNGSNIPFDPPKVAGDMREEAISHFATCPNAKEHRKSKPAAASTAAKPAAPNRGLAEPQTPELLERETIWFAQRHSARAVIVLCPGTLKAWALHPGEDPEQLRMDLITLVNAAKRSLEDQKKGATR
jgi:hypothetical protein